MNNVLLSVKNISKAYKQAGHADLQVLNGLSFDLHAGQMSALIGASGSGKSTLLHAVGLLDSYDSGTITLDSHDYGTLNPAQRTALRRDKIGFVYQFHYLQEEFTALENVMIPQIIAGKSKKQAAARATELLNDVMLSHRLSHRPARLSGGEKQRVAIARALANDPVLLLADEPTGNLDPETSESVFQMLKNLIETRKMTALIATHNLDLAARMNHQIKIGVTL
jgi:lipoprotein-releasing system ATP-binding protein